LTESGESEPAADGRGRGELSAPAVLAAVFVIATCGLVYELLAGTLASYVLGDSILQFSTVIGVYLSALGLGAFLSRWVDSRLVACFIEVEIAVALIGGASSAILFLAFAHLTFFRLVLYGLVLVVGALVGLEIPLLTRILQDRYDLKELLSRVLTVDYLGALVASLLFPMFLVPKLGLIRGAFATGLVNAGVALWSTWLFGARLPRPGLLRLLRFEAVGAIVLLAGGIAFSDRLTTLAEEDLYADEIVFARTSAYQRIVLTRGRSGFQLYLNGNLQFSSVDEHRYHEALVHPAMSVARARERSAVGSHGPRRVLVLGGGDGMALREILRYPEVEAITLVDLDPAMTELGSRHPLLVAQNHGAYQDPKVRVVHQDAMTWLEERLRAGGADPFDLVIVDFPDPNNFSLGKLYTTRFYGLVRRALAPGGAVAVQATSPFLARRAFWCVVETVEASGFFVRAYHAQVPAFGEWGFVLAAVEPFEVPSELLEAPLRYLTPDAMQAMFVFGADMARVPAEVNRLNNQVLVQYYDDEWARYY
jgi:spermidine synthase